MRIWFNRHFAVVARVTRLLQEASAHLPPFEVVVSHRHTNWAGYAGADVAFAEPAGLSAEEYLAWCLQTVKERRINLLVPGHEQSYLTKHAALFEAIGCRLLHAATPDILPNLHRKEWVYDDVKDLVRLPAYRAAATPAEVVEAVLAIERDGSVEACIKPCVSVYGKGYGRITASPERANDERQDVEAWTLASAPDGTCAPQLVMEYLPGPEFSVDIAARDGEVLAAVVREKPVDVEKKTQLLVVNPEISAAAELLVKRYRLNGMINVQFRNDVRGQACLLEINPRASGGIGMACLSGVNLPAIALKGFVDPQYRPSGSAITGIHVLEIPTAVVVPVVEQLPVELPAQREAS